jgi:hypothetical protein
MSICPKRLYRVWRLFVNLTEMFVLLNRKLGLPHLVDEADNDRKVLEKAHKMAMEGTPKQAKYAARFLAYSKNADTVCSDLVDVS